MTRGNRREENNWKTELIRNTILFSLLSVFPGFVQWVKILECSLVSLSSTSYQDIFLFSKTKCGPVPSRSDRHMVKDGGETWGAHELVSARHTVD